MLEQTPPAVEKACTCLQEGEKLINLRQKNILIADRSEHGWATVAEYEEDELGDNSDDEKCLLELRSGWGGRQSRRVRNRQKRRAMWENGSLWKGLSPAAEWVTC